MNNSKLKEIAAAAAEKYASGENPMPEIRREYPRIHYFAGHLPAEAVAGDFALQRHESGGLIQVEISRLVAGGPDGLIGGESVESDWFDGKISEGLG